MVVRRTLLKHGVYATLSVASLPIVERLARAQAAAGFDFYISPTGSDSNPGTLARPWSITALNTHGNHYAGKRVGLLDGNYNVHSLCQATPHAGWGAIALSVNGGSRASSPTVIAAVNARKATLTAAHPSSGALPTNEAAVMGQAPGIANQGNVIVDGLCITRSFGGGIWFAPSGHLNTNLAGKAAGIVVRNCDIYDHGGIVNNNLGGIKLHNCAGALISNNRIRSVQPNPGNAHPSNASGIFSFNSHSNVYEYNTIYDCNSGIHDKNPNNGNHTYRYNYIESVGAHPYSALQDCSGGTPGDVVTAHNNVLIGPQIWDSSDVWMPSKQGLVFYNNTCYSPGTSAAAFLYLAAGSQVSPPATVTFYNNVIYCAQVAGWAGAIRLVSGTVALSNYNVYRVDPGRSGLFSLVPPTNLRPPGTLYSLSAWQKETRQDGNSTATLIASSALFHGARREPSSYRLQPAAVARNFGRVGGKSSGAATDVGAWGGGATRIGCDFATAPPTVT